MTTRSLGSGKGRNVPLVKYVLQLEMVPLYIPSSMSGLTHYQPLSGGSFRKFARGGRHIRIVSEQEVMNLGCPDYLRGRQKAPLTNEIYQYS